METCCGFGTGVCTRVQRFTGAQACSAAHDAARHGLPCFFPQRSAAQPLGGRRGLPAAVLPPPGHRASPPIHTARKCSSDSLSVACHCALRSRLTFCRWPTQKNPSPLRPSELPSELLLLPPRSALLAPPHPLARMLLRHQHAPLLHSACAGNRCGAAAPSIFGAAEFGRYVATRFLADADLYGHRPTVWTQPRPSWFLCAPLRHLIPAAGSSLFAGPAYQSRPTRRPQLRASTPLDTPLQIRSLGMRRHNFCTGCLSILSTPQIWRAPAVLRDISGGTSYQTVRLVFRPYAQVLPSN